MNVLRKMNFIIGIVAVSAAFYHFFIDNLTISMNIVFSFIAVQFFLSGVQDIMAEKGDKRVGYINIFVSLLFGFLLIREFVAIF